MNNKLQLMAFLLGCLSIFVIYYLAIDNQIKKSNTNTDKVKTKHYEYENLEPHHKMKVLKHKTWYGDTMLVTVDTTYYYSK